MKLWVEEAAIWWVATNYSVSSRQGSRLLGLSPFTIPCLSLPDPCLSFTIYNEEDIHLYHAGEKGRQTQNSSQAEE